MDIPPRPDDWMFPPGRMIRRTSRERAILAAGPAAAVLQVGHPRVALGVAEHSDFTNDAIGRLNRTMQVVNAIVFGTRAEATAIRERMIRMHQRIRGSAAAAGVPGASTYHALEPDLLLWVLATLCMSGIAGWEWLMGEPMSPADREEYLTDIRVFGEVFGLERGYGPRGFGEFAEYYRGMLEGSELASHPVCTEQARNVIFPAKPRWANTLGHATAGLSVHFIPEPVRGRLGLSGLAWRPEAVERMAGVVRGVLPVLPAPVRFMPEYLRASGWVSF